MKSGHITISELTLENLPFYSRDRAPIIQKCTSLIASKEYDYLGLGAEVEGQPAALAWATIPQDQRQFASIDHFMVYPEMQNRGVGTALLNALLQGMQARGVTNTKLRHTQIGSNPDAHKAYLRIIDRLQKSYRLQNTILSDMYLIPTHRLDELGKHSWYQPDGIPSTLQILKLADCTPLWIEKLKAQETEYKKIDPTYMSPLTGEQYEKQASFFLIDREKDQPAGWMMASRIGENSIFVRNYYTFPEYRKSLLGPYMGSYFMHYLCKPFHRLIFKSIRASRSVVAVFQKYLRPLTTDHATEYLLDIDL